MGAEIPDDKEQLLGKGHAREHSAESCAKMAELINLGCGLGWVKGSTSSVVFASWRQCALWEGTLTPRDGYY